MSKFYHQLPHHIYRKIMLNLQIQNPALGNPQQVCAGCSHFFFFFKPFITLPGERSKEGKKSATFHTFITDSHPNTTRNSTLPIRPTTNSLPFLYVPLSYNEPLKMITKNSNCLSQNIILTTEFKNTSQLQDKL